LTVSGSGHGKRDDDAGFLLERLRDGAPRPGSKITQRPDRID